MAYFTTFAASCSVILLNKMPNVYAVLLCVFTVIGTYPGVFMQGYIVKVTGKQ